MPVAFPRTQEVRPLRASGSPFSPPGNGPDAGCTLGSGAGGRARSPQCSAARGRGDAGGHRRSSETIRIAKPGTGTGFTRTEANMALPERVEMPADGDRARAVLARTAERSMDCERGPIRPGDPIAARMRRKSGAVPRRRPLAAADSPAPQVPRAGPGNPCRQDRSGNPQAGQAHLFSGLPGPCKTAGTPREAHAIAFFPMVDIGLVERAESAIGQWSICPRPWALAACRRPGPAACAADGQARRRVPVKAG